MKSSKAKKKATKTKKAASLRKRAEVVLAKQKERLRDHSQIDLKKLVHELGTHQIELEMQNEELRRAQGELESSRVRYADLYDFAPVGYFTFDGDGLIREVNRTGTELLGSTKRLLLNKPMLPFIDPAHRMVFRNHLLEVMGSRVNTSCEISLLRKDGTSFPAQLNSISFHAGEEDPGVCRTVVSDITERRRAEDALHNSEKRYRLLFENMLDGFAYCKMLYDGRGRPMDFVYIDVNSAFGRLTGLNDVVGRKVTEVIPGIRESSPELFETYSRVALTGKPENFEIDFKPLALWLSISVYSTERGYFVAVFDDITERKRTESVMQARFRMLESATAAMSQNEALQMTLDEIEAQTCSTIGFYHFLDADQETLSLQNWSTNTLRQMCTAEGQGSHYNISQAGVWVDCVREQRPVIHNDYASLAHRRGMPPGHAAVTREMVVPIMRGGRIVAIIGVGNKPTGYTKTDVELALALGDLSWEIVERIRVEDSLRSAHTELKSRARELDEVNRELESFSYTVSHDLKAPLRSIEGFAIAIKEDCASSLDETGRDYFNRVVAASRRMSQLIDAMLTMARLTHNEIKQKDVNLSGLADVIVHELRKEQPERQVEFVIAQKIRVRGDIDMLRIVLENLLNNAWKFTSNQRTAKIEFGTAHREGKTVYFVRDDGAGFDMQFSDKLFKPFQRLHRESEFPGIGIGLAIAHRIILRHGGRLWAESAPGKGATFFFTL